MGAVPRLGGTDDHASTLKKSAQPACSHIDSVLVHGSRTWLGPGLGLGLGLGLGVGLGLGLGLELGLGLGLGSSRTSLSSDSRVWFS